MEGNERMPYHEHLWAELEKNRTKLNLGGGPDKILQQHERGKLTARERLDLLLDSGSFTESDPWIQNRCLDFGLSERERSNEGVVVGWGNIDQRLVYAFANDFTVMGGSLGEAQGTKICRILDQAIRVGAPVVGLNDSGGARIQEGMGALNGYCSLFFRTSIASGWIPQISVILGPCAGGTVYAPALTDFIIMVDPIAKMFITGPAVIKAVTGEDVSFEDLGGGKVHGRITGIAHFVVKSEQEAMGIVRRLLGFLPANSGEAPPSTPCTDSPHRLVNELREVLPERSEQVFDVRDVIRPAVDEGDFLEIQKQFAPNIVIGFARLNGRPVGIVGNQPRVIAGCLDVNASWKAARFVRFCDAFNLPLITFVDCPGYLPGLDQEHHGIIRNGAKLLYAYSEAVVPKITVILRKDYGGAYSAMCGKGMGADIVLAFPTAEVAVVGPEAAANVVFRNDIEKADQPAAKRAEMVEQYRQRFASPYKAAEWGLVDDIIDPCELRLKVISGLQALGNKKEWRPPKKHSNLPL